MVRPCLLLLAAALTFLPACNCGGKGETPAEGTAPTEPTSSVPGDPQVHDAIRVLGDEGAAVLVVRPERWTALHEALGPWLARLPAVVEPLRQAKDADDLPDVLAQALGLAPGPLKGWDPSRPIVASLGEVPYHGPPGAVTSALPVLDQRLPPVRHQVVVPATDAAMLVSALAERLTPGKPLAALVAGRPGARAVQIDETVVALLPQDTAVRVVIFDGGFITDPDERIEHMRGRLDPSPAKPVATPALSLLGRPDAVAAGWVRPWRMRPLSAWYGGNQVLRALATVSGGYRGSLMTKGMQILLDTELMMTDEGAELDDTALALVADQGVVRLHSVSSLTPEGEAILDAAGTTELVAAASDDALADLAVRADLRAMLDATEPPPAFAKIERASDVVEVILEGGTFSTLYLAMRHPFGMARVFERLARAERLPVSLDSLPAGAHLVWRGLNDETPRLAMAVHWPEGHPPASLTSLAALAKSERALSSLRVDDVKHQGRAVTVLGLGGESASAFDPSKSAPGDALFELRLSLAKLDARLGPAMPVALAAALAKTGDVTVTWERRGRALVGALAWSPAGGPAEPRAVAVDTSMRWDSPLGPLAGDPGAKCLGEAGRHLARGLGAMFMVAPAELATVAGRMTSEAEASLRCAASHEATAEAAAGLRRLAVGLTVDGLIQAHRDDAAVTLLERACKDSEDPQICARVEAQRALPHPTLPEVEGASECSPLADAGPVMDVGVEVRVDATRVAIERATVAPSAFASTLKAALADAESGPDLPDRFAMPPPLEGEEPTRRPSVELTIDGAVTMARVRPLLRAMVEQGVTDGLVVVRQRGSDHRALPMHLAAEPTIPSRGPTTGPTTGPTAGSPPATKSPGGILGMMAPPEGSLGATGLLDGDWALLEVSRDAVTTRSVTQPEPQAHTAPTRSLLREATTGAWKVYVHGADDVTWARMAEMVVVACDRAVLVLDVPSP